MRRSRYDSIRQRIIRTLRYAGVVFGIAAALLALFQVQRSALRTIQASSVAVHQSPTPLLSLTGVEIRVRRRGAPLVHFYASSLTLARDLREMKIADVRGGADAGARELPGGSPVAFSAADASVIVGPSFQQTAVLELDQASADTRVGSTPLHVAAPGLTWEWPQGLVRTTGEVSARIGSFGKVQCASLSLDTNKRMINFGPFQATIALAALGSAASFTPVSAQPPASGGGTSDSNKLQFIASQPDQTAQYSDNNKLFTINGPVRVIQGNVTMRTVGVVYNDVTKIATAQSPVTITNERDTLTGQHGTLNFSTHLAVITGDVHMSAIPDTSAKSSADAQASQPTNLTCDHVTYNYRSKLADADGHLKVFQKDRTVTADTGHYDVNAQLITMHGNVDGQSTDGKHLQAPEAVVSVNPNNQWIQVKGPIKYEFTMDDQDNPLPPVAHPNTTATQTAPPTAPQSSPTAPPVPVNH